MALDSLKLADRIALLEIELEAERAKVAKLEQFICEQVCYDDCGFLPEEESRETLIAIFKARDEEARQLLKEIEET